MGNAASAQERLLEAAQGGDVSALREMMQGRTDAELKTHRGAVDDDGNTALLLAAKGGHADAVKVLIDAGFDVHGANHISLSALLLAANAGHLAVLVVLLNNGANVNFQQPRHGRWTALTSASAKGYDRCVDLLLERGADHSLPVANGRTAVHLAAHENHCAVVALLRYYGAAVDVKDNDGVEAVELVPEGPEHDEMRRILTDTLSFTADCAATRRLVEFHEAELAAREIEFGPEHPSVAAVLVELGCLGEGQKKYEEAMACYDKAIMIVESFPELETLDPNSSFNVSAAVTRCTALNNLASIQLHKEQDAEKGAELYLQALTHIRAVYGRIHQITANCLTNLSNAYAVGGKFDQAVRIGHEALDVEKKLYGPRTIMVADSLLRLATTLQKAGSSERSWPLCDEAVSIMVERLGAKHERVGSTYLRYAMLCHDADQHSTCDKLAEKALSVFAKNFGEIHSKSLECTDLRAASLDASDDLARAVKWYKRGLDIAERLANKHPKQFPEGSAARRDALLPRINTVADALWRMGRPREALPYFERAVDVAREIADGEPLDAHAIEDALVRVSMVKDHLLAAAARPNVPVAFDYPQMGPGQ